MRTREEQISALEEDIFSNALSLSARTAALAHILEAERRAERRVRAEIDRDSERLDWLERQFILMALVKGPAPVAPDKKLDAVFTQTGGIPFRQAIDAAREVG
ncbi:hypothetical protein GOB86_14595 [Acetobacter lambici]|uniref:Uncharacterized protein n=1 Tax=Acetobacter lambici TaxID=1332824 RepID=A0ABT1F4F9_9PROT|nr:hypothetical protein [Acetobacter lambici]MCP1244204.1 hypothetical protein [Acetobacter lambici]MCP1260111.1 hypothetical protein [Acetobacter lambici]NHO58241.1 hypothetical protein [Acetobacter lambici]